jgi:hypothetical protein
MYAFSLNKNWILCRQLMSLLVLYKTNKMTEILLVNNKLLAWFTSLVPGMVKKICILSPVWWLSPTISDCYLHCFRGSPSPNALSYSIFQCLKSELVVVVHNCNPRTQEAEAGGWRVWGQSVLHSKFKATLEDSVSKKQTKILISQSMNELINKALNISHLKRKLHTNK